MQGQGISKLPLLVALIVPFLALGCATEDFSPTKKYARPETANSFGATGLDAEGIVLERGTINDSVNKEALDEVFNRFISPLKSASSFVAPTYPD